MRICVQKPDGAYGWDIVPVGVYEVVFNGELLDKCVAADDLTGEAWVHDVDENGRLKVSPTHDIELKKLFGKVEIRKIQK